jgi:hypothetical protein
MDKIYITIDGETIEATGQALKDVLDHQAKCKAEAELAQAEAEAKAQAKAELLDRLGITADEAKLLLA